MYFDSKKGRKKKSLNNFSLAADLLKPLQKFHITDRSKAVLLMMWFSMLLVFVTFCTFTLCVG